MSEILKDPRQYVRRYLEVHKITINERGELLSPSKKNNLEIFDTMYLDYCEQVRAHNATEAQKAANLRASVGAIKETILQKALNEFITEKKLEYRKKVIAALKCTKEDLTEVRKFIAALKGYEDENDITVMAHWLWQVKMKMNGRTPIFHMMPIFFGKQKGGKTAALAKLIAPLNNFRLNISMDQMTDDRYYKAMSENYIVVFDEMEGAARTDIDALKKQITIEENDYRPMRTNDVFKVRQNCSFIGATNRPVAEQIVDSTGMRRFWQLDCMDRLNWDLLNQIDFYLMWCGIDESRKDGYILPRINEIDAKQQEMVAKDQISAYMEERRIVLDKEPTKEVTASALYGDYRQWCADNGFKPLDNSWFGRKISGKGLKKEVRAINGKTYNIYKVPEDVMLYTEQMPYAISTLTKTGTW